MPDTKEPTSMNEMFTMLGEHDDLIKKDIMPMITELKSSQAENTDEIQGIKSELQGIKAEVTAVRNAQSSLELTVMKDGQHTRDLLNQFVAHYFSADGKVFKSTEKVTIQKMTTKEKLWLGFFTVLTAGGMTALSSVAIAFLNR